MQTDRFAAPENPKPIPRGTLCIVTGVPAHGYNGLLGLECFVVRHPESSDLALDGLNRPRPPLDIGADHLVEFGSLPADFPWGGASRAHRRLWFAWEDLTPIPPQPHADRQAKVSRPRRPLTVKRVQTLLREMSGRDS